MTTWTRLALLLASASLLLACAVKGPTAGCTEGDTRRELLGTCCPGTAAASDCHHEYECINGYWEQLTSDCHCGCPDSGSADTGDADATDTGEDADGDAAPDTTDPSMFVIDDRGGALVLRGLNVAGDAKWHPARQPWVERDDVLRISRDWGFNYVRYLIFWDAIEPEPGVYDEAYLDRVEERLDWHAEAGIHVVLDMHQDLYSRFLCPPGDGAPEWAIETDDQPWPNPDDYPRWEAYHTSAAVMAAFENFFDYEGDHPELQDHYVAMWTHVAERFRDHPAVLGYEVMNEPYSAHAFADPDRFDQEWLVPFYERWIAAIREVDPDTWLFYEPQAFLVSDGSPQSLPRFEDPRPGPPRLVYNPHLYLLAAINSRDDHEYVRDRLDRWERNRRVEVEEYQTPIVVGEFWAEHGEDDPSFFPWYVLEELATFDRLMAGWAYWDHSPTSNLLDAEGAEKALAGHLARPYPRRVAGEPLAFGYDPDTRVFELRYRDRLGAEGDTEIYVPAARHYPDGWTLEVSDAEGTWEQVWDGEREVLALTLPRTDGEHTIRIEPVCAEAGCAD